MTRSTKNVSKNQFLCSVADPGPYSTDPDPDPADEKKTDPDPDPSEI